MKVFTHPRRSINAITRCTYPAEIKTEALPPPTSHCPALGPSCHCGGAGDFVISCSRTFVLTHQEISSAPRLTALHPHPPIHFTAEKRPGKLVVARSPRLIRLP
jgi:hypothetical protein